MSKFNNEYYTFFPIWGENTPTIDFADGIDSFDFPEEGPITQYNVIKFEFEEIKPKNPQMCDFLSGTEPDGEAFSKKFIDIVQSFSPKGNQFIPATIYDPKNKKDYPDYFYIHTYAHIVCLDREKSEIDIFDDGDVLSVDGVSFDTAIMESIPLEERLIFRLGEWNVLRFIHKSIVDKLIAEGITGIRFVSAADYNAGSAFDDFR